MQKLIKLSLKYGFKNFDKFLRHIAPMVEYCLKHDMKVGK